MSRIIAPVLISALAVAACGSTSSEETTDESTQVSAEPEPISAEPEPASADTESTATDEPADATSDAPDDDPDGVAVDGDSSEPAAESAATATSTFRIDVWADNWMAVHVDGELIGEDSVPITTERSFNAESFTFEATSPFTLAIEAKDFKETDSGIEYIGERNQQMGDGGIIAQVVDTATGEVVAVTDGDWSALVIHRAPLNTECVSDPDPDATCEFEATSAPDGWTTAAFDDSAWTTATEWSAEAVSPKDGYDEIEWDDAAALVWGSDLEVDNTVLLRTIVGG